MYRLIMVIGAVAAIGIAAGCGSSGEEATSAPLTKAQFIKQADAICTKFGKQRQAAARSFISNLPGGTAEVEAHLDEAMEEIVAPSLREEAKDLADLQPPRSDGEKAVQLIERLSQAGSYIEDHGGQGGSHSPLSLFEEEASAYGFKVCSKPN